MTDEAAIEKELNDKELNAPRLSPDLINSVITGVEYHVFEESQQVVCCLTLLNGYAVVGDSGCVSPENFDLDIGKKISRHKAREKIWGLEGYLLQSILAGQVTVNRK